MSPGTPLDDGLSMPAEWAPHARCWMAWPSRLELWGDRLMEARVACGEAARAIAGFEPVTVLARHEHVAEASLGCGPGIEVMPMMIDDCWARDTGPTFLTDGREGVAGVDWSFNAWGNRFHDHADDARVAAAVLEHLGMRRYAAPIVLEGGAFHVDGAGTVIATEQCLLNPNRNPLLSRREVEEVLLQYVGARRLIWLGQGLAGDPTDGHVDNVACFARPGLALAAMPDDRDDPNHPIMRDNVDRLRASRDARGNEIEVVELPQPRRRPADDGPALTMSYVNFYLANGAVIMPSFEDPADAKARATLAKVFAEREVVAVPATAIAAGGGIHSITQQQPAGTALG